MKRIGILTHNYPLHSKDRKDAGIFLYDFAKELSKENKVYVLCPSFFGKKEKYEGVEVTWFKWMGGNEKLGSLNIFNPISILKFLNLLIRGSSATKKFVEDNKIDFLLCAWIIPAGIYGMEAKRTTRVSYATWSLGSDINQYLKIPLLKQLIILAAKKADINFANSYLLCNKVSELTGRKCIFLPAITNFKRHNVVISKKNKIFRYLFVGRLERVKGIDLLIEACKQLAVKKLDFRLLIVGEGALEEIVKKSTLELGLSDKIEFKGRLGAEEIEKCMIDADCLVIPSRSESLPLVLIEAAKTLLPVVAADVGDCARIIKSYDIGYISKSENAADLAKKMLMAASERDKFKLKRSRNLKIVADLFDQKNAAKLLIENIKSL